METSQDVWNETARQEMVQLQPAEFQAGSLTRCHRHAAHVKRSKGRTHLTQRTDPSEETFSQHTNSVGFVKKTRKHRWSSESSDNNMVIAMKQKQETHMKIAGLKLMLGINGHQMPI